MNAGIFYPASNWIKDQSANAFFNKPWSSHHAPTTMNQPSNHPFTKPWLTIWRRANYQAIRQARRTWASPRRTTASSPHWASPCRRWETRAGDDSWDDSAGMRREPEPRHEPFEWAAKPPDFSRGTLEWPTNRWGMSVNDCQWMLIPESFH